jgi:hypothetical protein
MDLLEFIYQTSRINIAMASVVSVGLLLTFIAHFNNRGGNFRSSRNKRARRQF